MTEQVNIKALLICITVAAATFAFDLSMPLGVAGGVPYVALVLIGLWMPGKKFIYVLATVASILTVAGYFLSVSSGLAWVAFTNRGLALFAIWTTAILVAHRGRARNTLKKIHNELKERVQRRTSELVESEARFADFAKSASDWFWETGPKLDFSFGSDRFFEIMGWQSEEVYGRSREFLVDRNLEDLANVKWQNHFANLERREPFANFEYAARTKLGTYKYLSISGVPVFAADGTFRGYRGTGSDITDRKVAEHQLRDSEYRLRSIMTHVPDGVVTINSDGIIKSVNPATENMFGWTAEELAGQNVSILMAEPDRSRHDKYLQNYARTGKGQIIGRQPIVVTGQRKDGSNISLELALGKINLEDGHLFVGVMRDISERQRLQGELVQASKLATLGEMATGVAHELNQPLNVIRMAAESTIELIEEGECDTDFILSKFNRISQQTVRAAGIIDHMRVFGRKSDAAPIALDVVECINDAIDFMSEQLRVQGISIETDFPRDARVMAVGHQVQLEQVILNLIGNARDAIDMNGNGDDQPRVIKISLTHAGNDVVDLKVRDTGGGIPENVIDRLFEPFFTTKEVGKGTGLGLSVSYGIITDMGGKLQARNVEGGAEFTISLTTVADTETLAQEVIA